MKANLLSGAILFALAALTLTPGSSAQGQAPSQAATIKLPEPATDGGMPLGQTLSARRSVRAYDGKAIPLANVSQLLWAAQGVTEPMPNPPATWNPKWGQWRGGRRTAPSAGALYPLEVYVLATAVDGLERGLYRYIPGEHALVRTGAVEPKDLAKAALGQDDIAQASLVVIIAGVYERTAAKYGERAPRYVHIEVGAAAENLMLQASGLGLSTVIIGAFVDEAVQKTLALPADQAPLAIIPVGHPPAR